MPTADALAPAYRWAGAGLAAALGAAAVARFGGTAQGAITAFGVAVLGLLAVIDVERRLVPNRIVLPSAALVLAAQIAVEPDRTFEWLAATFGAAAFLLIPALVKPGGIGMGDVKLALLMGALLGAAVTTAFFLAFAAVIPVAAAILVRGGAGARQATIPLVPFLAFGAIAVALLG